jgi:hypothetical protein
MARAGALSWTVAVLSVFLARSAVADEGEYVEIEVSECQVARAEELRRISPTFAARPAAVGDGWARENPGVIIRGVLLQVRRVEQDCLVPGGPVGELRLSPWTKARRNDRVLFVPVAGSRACDYFPTGESRLLGVTRSICPSDAVGEEEVEWYDETRAHLLTEYALIPPNYEARLAAEAPKGVFGVDTSIQPPPLPNPPKWLRTILGTRVHRTEVHGLPRLHRWKDQPQYTTVSLSLELAGSYPAMCALGHCWLAGAGHTDGNGNWTEANFFLPTDQAGRVAEALRDR